MKHALFFLCALLILGTVIVERSGLAWSWERPVLCYLTKITARSLPTVTAIKLSSDAAGLLIPQDVALTLRAVISFHPQQILIAAPLGDLSSGPLSLIKEGLETGVLQNVPCCFAALADRSTNALWAPAHVLIFPENTKLPSVSGKINSSSPLGFIVPEADLAMPLFARAEDGLVASLWGRSLFQNLSEKSLPFLLWGQFLHLPNNAMVSLQRGGLLKSALALSTKTLLLDDLLLHREEMERGSIRPDLDLLFRNQTVLIGRSNVSEQAARLEQAIQQASVGRLSSAWYGLVLLLFSLFLISVARADWIDFLLIIIFSFLIYGGLIFWLFCSHGILLPLFLPLAILFSLGVRKLVVRSR
ncbi:MAG: hypothetical protein ACH346_06250 [Chthoniobacterales bacterium]